MILVRYAVSIALLVFVVWQARPYEILRTASGCEPLLLGVCLACVPLFLFMRIAKWGLLVRQAERGMRGSVLVADYLWGMALGFVTPGRVGELARVRHMRRPGRGLALFAVEKCVELLTLAGLCLLGAALLGVVPVWSLLAGLGCLSVIYFRIPRLMAWLARDGGVFSRLPLVKKLESSPLEGPVGLNGCAALSATCQALFLFQVFLLIRALVPDAPARALYALPVMLLGNLIPVTIGGFGPRELIALYLLEPLGVPEAATASAVFLTAVFNLAAPGLAGSVLHLALGRNEESSRA